MALFFVPIHLLGPLRFPEKMHKRKRVISAKAGSHKILGKERSDLRNLPEGIDGIQLPATFLFHLHNAEPRVRCAIQAKMAGEIQKLGYFRRSPFCLLPLLRNNKIPSTLVL